VEILTPAFFTTDRKELLRYAQRVAGWGRHDLVEIGLPLRMAGGALSERSSYFTVPLDVFFSAERRDAARRQRQALARQVLAAAPGARLLVWNRLVGRRLVLDEERLGWSLMLILWALEEAPPAYFRESKDFGLAFADYLEMRDELESAGGQMAVFRRRLLSLERVWRLREEKEFAIQARVNPRLEYLANGKKNILEAYAKAWLMAFGFLTGVTEVLVLDLLLEGFISYLNFLSDLDDLSTDYDLATEEKLESWLSFAGIFLPFVRVLPEKIGALINGTLLLAVLTLFLKTIIQGLTGLLQALPRTMAALSAGAQTYNEVPVVTPAPDDPQQDEVEVLFIPLG
jgi:hypothetical protein